ncbi:U7 snRNA-associated Sm-like protein LSm11 isoform X2 [Felis catus]|uniref:U7 snRNA-associated Sm-like protein LSm11 isoform X2 n=1 Tax=Felis catus TaxID=9685 RepID=UPI001D19A654|nr:U7 snRNA-associated Sm-like protein LSm11 isoform X2 [Felis catus]
MNLLPERPGGGRLLGADSGQMLPPGGRAGAVQPQAAAAQCRPLAAPLLLPIGLGLRAFQTWRSGSGGRGRLAPGAPRARPARGWMSALTASTRCWPCTRPACRPYPTQTRPASTTWPMHEGSPLGELHRCIREGVKVNVHIRTFKGLRGVCTGFLVAFDKFWNMALTDVDETYRKPVLGKAYERDSSLTLTRLFDRLKLQDSSKKDADSKSAVEDSTLSRYSQTSTWKVASVWGRGDTDRGSRRRSRSVPSSLQASAREESRSEMSGRTTRTEGSSAGGTFSRATTLSRGQPRKKKRKPKVDYQQVFTRHINQIFIRGENVLLVHLAQ